MSEPHTEKSADNQLLQEQPERCIAIARNDINGNCPIVASTNPPFTRNAAVRFDVSLVVPPAAEVQRFGEEGYSAVIRYRAKR